ncbi:MAG: hypothetical protein PUP93_21605 [Rhizonema sp. NSF051]|nr:hypothetical protein [Rhizonema sp. NSF051]
METCPYGAGMVVGVGFYDTLMCAEMVVGVGFYDTLMNRAIDR